MARMVGGVAGQTDHLSAKKKKKIKICDFRLDTETTFY